MCTCLVVASALLLANYNEASVHPNASNSRQVASGVGLTIDPDIQRLAQNSASAALQNTAAKRGTALVLEANTGQVRAMVNVVNSDPTVCPPITRSCNPVSQNTALAAWEPGSVIKPLLLAAALNSGTLQPDSHYFDPQYVRIKDRVYTNAVSYPAQTISLQDILSKSLNTGAVYGLKSLGNGTVNQQARQSWYDYLTKRYRFGRPTGIELPGEASGTVRPPSGGRNIETQYAGMAFGVGLTVTPLQLAAAYAALVNGGTYYQPHLHSGPSKILAHQVVSTQVSDTMVHMLQLTLQANNHTAVRSGYLLGAKSGTAPVPGADGAYKIGVDNGTYVGFIGKTTPQYIVLVRLDEPQTNDFASVAARQAWTNLTNQLIDNNKIK